MRDGRKFVYRVEPSHVGVAPGGRPRFLGPFKIVKVYEDGAMNAESPDGPVFELWSLDSFMAGIAIDRTEGAPRWMNQVGGTCCYHLIARGLLVPLPSVWAPTLRDSLRDWALQRYDKKRVAKWIKKVQLDGVFAALDEADAPAGREEYDIVLAEAWVPVRVLKNVDQHWLKPFADERMILTYKNSD